MRAQVVVVAVVAASWCAVPGGASAAASQPLTGELNGVWCQNGVGCAAVGSYQGSSGVTAPLGAAGNASRWVTAYVPSPAGYRSAGLSAVSCAGSTCQAVGSYTTRAGAVEAFAVQSTGSHLAASTPGTPAGASSSSLSGVSCATSSACFAVGSWSGASGAAPLIEQRNGSVWSLMSVPTPSGGSNARLTAVSCTSASACTAVGSYTPDDGQGSEIIGTLAERWDGQAWSVQTTADPSSAAFASFSGVSCASSTSCSAVGSVDVDSPLENTLAEHWDGSSWALQATPELPGRQYGPEAQLNAVSCPSTSDCTSVGYYLEPEFGDPEAVIERWNGSSWSLQTAASPAGIDEEELNGVWCTNAASCTAVGERPDVSQPLVERWDGSSWAFQTPPSPF